MRVDIYLIQWDLSDLNFGLENTPVIIASFSYCFVRVMILVDEQGHPSLIVGYRGLEAIAYELSFETKAELQGGRAVAGHYAFFTQASTECFSSITELHDIPRTSVVEAPHGSRKYSLLNVNIPSTVAQTADRTLSINLPNELCHAVRMLKGMSLHTYHVSLGSASPLTVM